MSKPEEQAKAAEEARQALAKENFNLKQSLFHLQAKLRSRAGTATGAAQLQEDNIELERRLLQLEEEAHAPRRIRTVRGHGYRLVPVADATSEDDG